MAHLLRSIPDSLLVRGYVTTGVDLASIDQKTFVSINGDEGGTWTPSTAILIGGAGVTIAGPWTMTGAALVVSGGILFARGTTGDYFGFLASHPNATPVVHIGFFEYYTPTFGDVAWFGGLLPTRKGARFWTPLGVWGGATKINSVAVSWRVREAHANLPQYLPRMRVIAVSEDGVIFPLRAKDATTDIDGFQFLPTPASGAAYYNAGAAQTWTYTCNVTLPIDLAKYSFYAEFIEESGTNAWVSDGSQFYSAGTSFSNVTIFDGRN